ncbi:hypothetical protein ACFLV2_02280 [Chloroflexota bacterium]
MFELHWADTAKDSFEYLKADASKQKQYKAVKNTFKKLALDPFYPSLNSHEYHSLKGPNGEKVFESYAENRTSKAYRIFWYYGSRQGTIKVFLITPHP